MSEQKREPAAAKSALPRSTQQAIHKVAGIFQEHSTASTLIESFAEAFLVINQAGTIMLVNQRFSELFDYTAEEIVGQQLETIIPERFRQSHSEHTRSYFQSPHARPMGRDLELRGLRRDGSEFPVEVSISFLQNSTEKLGMAFITDITARAATEQELQRENRALSDFAQTVAHDLKSLISVLTGFSELLELEYENLSPEDRQSSLNSVREASLKMNDIINELLFLAKAKREEVVLKKIDLKSAVEEALKRLQWKTEATGADIIVGDLESKALGHQPWIEEAIYNLVSNALSHGGDNITVRIDTEPAGRNTTRVRISDNGDGMPKEQLQILLEKPEELPYTWVKGHGLGLSIVHHVLEKLGSSLEIQCHENQGCCFCFQLSTAD